jgi:predicted nucleic acid-binding protein
VILVDTSVWIDHLHKSDPDLVALLNSAEVAQHPMVIGELTLGSLSQRRAVLDNLSELPTLTVATHYEVMYLVDQRRLFGQGLSLVDAHLLTSVLLSPGAELWTRDKKLTAAATQVGVAFADPDSSSAASFEGH